MDQRGTAHTKVRPTVRTRQAFADATRRPSLQVDDACSSDNSLAQPHTYAPGGFAALQRRVILHGTLSVIVLVSLALLARSRAVSGLRTTEHALEHVRARQAGGDFLPEHALDVSEYTLAYQVGGVEGLLYLLVVASQVAIVSAGHVEWRAGHTHADGKFASSVGLDILEASAETSVSESGAAGGEPLAHNRCRSSTTLSGRARQIMVWLAALAVIERSLSVLNCTPMLLPSSASAPAGNETLVASHAQSQPDAWAWGHVNLSTTVVFAAFDCFILELCMLLSGHISLPVGSSLAWTGCAVVYASHLLDALARFMADDAKIIVVTGSALVFVIGGMLNVRRAMQAPNPGETNIRFKDGNAASPAHSDRSEAWSSQRHMPMNDVHQSEPMPSSAPSCAPQPATSQRAMLQLEEEVGARRQLQRVAMYGFGVLCLSSVTHTLFRAVAQSLLSPRIAPFVDTTVLVTKGALLPSALLLATWGVHQRLALRRSVNEHASMQRTQYLRERKLLRYICHELRSPLNTLSLVTEELSFMAQQHGLEHTATHSRSMEALGTGSSTAEGVHATAFACTAGTSESTVSVIPPRMEPHTITPKVHPPPLEQVLHTPGAAQEPSSAISTAALPQPQMPAPFGIASAEELSDLSATSLTAVLDIQHALDNIVSLEAARSDNGSPVAVDLLQYVSEVLTQLDGVAQDRRAHLDVIMSTSRCTLHSTHHRPSSRHLGSSESSVHPLISHDAIGKSTRVLAGSCPQIGVRASPGDIRHVLNVLVSNALRFGVAGTQCSTPLARTGVRSSFGHIGKTGEATVIQTGTPSDRIHTVAYGLGGPSPADVPSAGQTASETAGTIRVRVTIVDGAALVRARKRQGVIIGKAPGAGQVPGMYRNDSSLLLYVEVQDSGTGIERDQMGLLFQEFAMIRASARSKKNSTGLGLAVARHLVVSRMEGIIGAWSDGIGHGATFWFAISLPKVPTSALGAAVVSASILSTTSTFAQEGSASLILARVKKRSPTARSILATGHSPAWLTHGTSRFTSTGRADVSAAPSIPLAVLGVQGGAYGPSAVRYATEDATEQARLHPASSLAEAWHGPAFSGSSSSETGLQSSRVREGVTGGAIPMVHAPNLISSTATAGLHARLERAATHLRISVPDRQGQEREVGNATEQPTQTGAEGASALPADRGNFAVSFGPLQQGERAERPTVVRSGEVHTQGSSLKVLRETASNRVPACDDRVHIQGPGSRSQKSTESARRLTVSGLSEAVGVIDSADVPQHAESALSQAEPDHVAADAAVVPARQSEASHSCAVSQASTTRASSLETRTGGPVVESLPDFQLHVFPLSPQRMLHHAHSGRTLGSSDRSYWSANVAQNQAWRASAPSHSSSLGRTPSLHGTRSSVDALVNSPLPEESPLPSATHPPTQPHAPLSWLNMCIVVDDVSSNRRFLAQLLRRLGVANVMVAEDGSDAFIQLSDLALSQATDELHTHEVLPAPAEAAPVGPLASLHAILPVVFTDQEMPLCKGHELAQRLRSNDYRGRIVGVTGNAHRTDIERMLASGMEAVMIKPVKRTELLKRLARLFPTQAANDTPAQLDSIEEAPLAPDPTPVGGGSD